MNEFPEYEKNKFGQWVRVNQTPSREDIQHQKIESFVGRNFWTIFFVVLALAIALATFFSFVLGYSGAAIFDFVWNLIFSGG
jgi:hypothetical protein